MEIERCQKYTVDSNGRRKCLSRLTPKGRCIVAGAHEPPTVNRRAYLNINMTVDLSITSRELDILTLVRHGLENAEIGEKLHIAEDTVKSRMARLLRKLQARNRTELVDHAWLIGIFSNEAGPLPEGEH